MGAPIACGPRGAAQSCPMFNKKCPQSYFAARVILHTSQKPVPSHETLQILPSSSYNPCSLDPAVLCRLGVGSRAAALPEGRDVKNDCSRRIRRRHSDKRTRLGTTDRFLLGRARASLGGGGQHLSHTRRRAPHTKTGRRSASRHADLRRKGQSVWRLRSHPDFLR